MLWFGVLRHSAPKMNYRQIHPDSRKVFQLLRTFINDDMDKISSHLAHTHTNSFRDWDSEVNDFISKQSDRLNCT